MCAKAVTTVLTKIYLLPPIISPPSLQNSILLSRSHFSFSMKMNSAEFGGSEAAPDLEESSVREWTNEKHSSYLKSIEASFVNQLYDSLDYPGQNSTQFKVLQNGLWHKVSFENPKSRFSKADEFRSVVTNPWIRRFRSASKLDGCRTRSLKEIDAITEVSDQNFVGEAIQVHSNAEDNGCSNGLKRKRSTSVNAKTSSSFDQVVPL